MSPIPLPRPESWGSPTESSGTLREVCVGALPGLLMGRGQRKGIYFPLFKGWSWKGLGEKRWLPAPQKWATFAGSDPLVRGGTVFLGAPSPAFLTI